MKTIITLKKIFSIYCAIVLAIIAYFGVDGHKYTLFQGLFTISLVLSIFFIWNKNLYNALIEDQSLSFKKSEISQLYYLLFELFGFLMVFAVSLLGSYKIIVFFT